MGCWGKIVSMVQRRQLKSSGLRRKTLEANGVTFHYAERGTASEENNSPSLLILHGFAESMEAWGEVVQKLPKNIHVLTLDLPGHGKAPLKFNSDPSTPASLSNFAAFVASFIHTKSLDVTSGGAGLHVLGHSMGGAIAAQLAASFGSDAEASPNGTATSDGGIRWLTLAAPAMVTPKPSPFWNAVLEGKFEDWLIPTSLEGTREMVKNVTGLPEAELNTCKTKLMIKGVMQLRAPQNATLRLVWSDFQADLDRFDEILETWRKIKAKTHILWGEEDLIINCSGADTLSSLIPSSTVELLAKTHHGINLVVPAKTAESIAQFREKAAWEDEQQQHQQQQQKQQQQKQQQQGNDNKQENVTTSDNADKCDQ